MNEDLQWSMDKFKLVASERNNAWAMGLWMEALGLNDWEIIRLIQYFQPNTMSVEEAYLHTDCIAFEYIK